MCNLTGCDDLSAHVHLRKCDEQAIADVLLADWYQRNARRLVREQRLAREQERQAADLARYGEDHGPGFPAGTA
jgi:hypothetical protein